MGKRGSPIVFGESRRVPPRHAGAGGADERNVVYRIARIMSATKPEFSGGSAGVMGSAEAVRVFGERVIIANPDSNRMCRTRRACADCRSRPPPAEHLSQWQSRFSSIAKELRKSLPFGSRHGVQSMFAHDALGFLSRHRAPQGFDIDETGINVRGSPRGSFRHFLCNRGWHNQRLARNQYHPSTA